MGTRADFYVGRGESAEWLGSIAWDGYPDGIAVELHAARTEADWRAAVERFLSGRDDASRPAEGWPWPWDTSATTDYAYAFDNGRVHASCFGGKWYRSTSKKLADDGSGKVAVFPDMKDKARVVLSGKRSGLIVIGL